MSGWYDIGKEKLLARTIPEDAGVYAVGVNEDYIYAASHISSAVFTPYILLPDKLLQGVSFTGGLLRAENPTWLAAGAGIADRSLVLAGVAIFFRDSTPEDHILAFIDSAQAGLPQTLSGVDVTGTWHPTGILKL